MSETDRIIGLAMETFRRIDMLGDIINNMDFSGSSDDEQVNIDDPNIIDVHFEEVNMEENDNEEIR